MRIASIGRLAILSAITALIAIVMLALSASDTRTTDAQWVPNTPQFKPTFDTRLCNALSGSFGGPDILKGTGDPFCAQDGTPGGHPDLSTVFDVPLGHENFSGGLTNTLRDFTLTDHTTIPLGTAMGGLFSDVTLGLAANPCSNPLSPEFILWNGSTDIADTIAIPPPATSNRFAALATDLGDAFFGKADADSPGVLQYPEFNNAFFDPDGDGIDTDGNPATPHDQPVKPLARYIGLTQVPAGGDWQVVQVFIFAPGALEAAFSTSTASWKHPFAKLTTLLGQTTVSFINDPTVSVSAINPISDFCTHLGVRATLLGMVDTTGDGNGDTPRLTAPGGTIGHQAQTRVQSQRDADDDGIENSFDTCPWIPNTAAQNPYITAGPDSPQGDMLDSVCDPTPATNTNFADHDGDGYLNNQDLCPLHAVASPADQLDSENDQDYNVAAPDGGPQADSIGDACDGVVHALFNPSGLGDPDVADGDYFNEIHVDSVCIGGTDDDDDGWCAGLGVGFDPDDNDPNIGGSFSPVRLPSTANSDADSFNDSLEWSIGSDPAYSCRLINGHDTWPPDFNSDGNANILDIVQLTPPTFNTAPPNANYRTRKDLNHSGNINILDIVQLTPPVFNTTCPP